MCTFLFEAEFTTSEVVAQVPPRVEGIDNNYLSNQGRHRTVVWSFPPVLFYKKLLFSTLRKATTWLYLPCSWPARSLTCLFSCGRLHCWKVFFPYPGKTWFMFLVLLEAHTLTEDSSFTVRIPWLSFVAVPVDLNKALGNNMDAHEAAQMHQNFSQQLLQDHIAACSLPEHNLISVCETASPICLHQHNFLLLFHIGFTYFHLFTVVYLFSVSMFCSSWQYFSVCFFFFFFSVDWWPSSCPDPSPKWPNHQPRKPAMRNQLSDLHMTVAVSS